MGKPQSGFFLLTFLGLPFNLFTDSSLPFGKSKMNVWQEMNSENLHFDGANLNYLHQGTLRNFFNYRTNLI